MKSARPLPEDMAFSELECRQAMKLLALSGSLRRTSYNSAAIHALKKLAPDDVVVVTGSIAELPLYNPDREGEEIPAVEKLKSQIKECQGLIIASPEYAHGVSGPMKNALDWLVGGDEFPHKPVMLINTSPRASLALDSLREILGTMSGEVIESASVAIPLLGSGRDADGIIADKDLSELLRTGLTRFCDVCRFTWHSVDEAQELASRGARQTRTGQASSA